MAARKIKPHQQAILDAFDAGERDPKVLAERSGYSVNGVYELLLRYGRKPRDRKEVGRSPERLAQLAQARLLRWGDLTGAERRVARERLRVARDQIIAEIKAARKLAA